MCFLFGVSSILLKSSLVFIGEGKKEADAEETGKKIASILPVANERVSNFLCHQVNI